MPRCGYCTIEKFLKKVTLKGFTENMLKLLPNSEPDQIAAWEDCYNFLQLQLKNLSSTQKKSMLIFEYKLENQKRPDVLILSHSKLIILEFKSGKDASLDHLAHNDQVIGYANRFRSYHVETYQKELAVHNFVVYTNDIKANSIYNTLTGENFIKIISNLIDNLPYPNSERWRKSQYEPIPDILSSIDTIFTKEDLPAIMTSRSNITEILQTIDNIVGEKKKSLNVVFVSGEPGAGKTLLGLQLVKESNDIANGKQEAVYLTGNMPLGLVLQYEINKACYNKFVNGREYGEAYVKFAFHYLNKSIDNYIRSGQSSLIKEDLLIFDEGQRAWDQKKMEKHINKKRKNLPKVKFPFSEGGFLIWLLSRNIQSTGISKTIVCLIGDGQEIYDGEEQGMKSWLKQIQSESEIDIKIYAPKKYFNYLKGLNVVLNDSLYLNTYHRGHAINEFPMFVRDFLDNKPYDTKNWLKKMQDVSKEYPIYITKNLSSAKRYLLTNKTDGKRFGIINSSFSQENLSQYEISPLKTEGVSSDKYRDELGRWYNGECRQLKKSVNEFDSQGLELDIPILFWGEDLIRKDDNWHKNKTMALYDGKSYDRLKKFDNPLQILKNIYRVLLTRGREGLIIWIPFEEYPALIETYNYLKSNLGVTELNYDK